MGDIVCIKGENLRGLLDMNDMIEIYYSPSSEHLYCYNGQHEGLSTKDFTGCHFYGPYFSLGSGSYEALYETEMMSGDTSMIYADVFTQYGNSIEKSEFTVEADGSNLKIRVNFSLAERKDKVEIRILSNSPISLKLNRIRIYKTGHEYAEYFSFVVKSYIKDTEWAYYNYLSTSFFARPRCNFYIIVPASDIIAFTQRFLRGMESGEIQSMPIILAEEDLFQRTREDIPESFTGWFIQQVAKLCFSKTGIAENYCTLDSAMIFTKEFNWEKELFVGTQIVTAAEQFDREKRKSFFIDTGEKGWLNNRLVNISESFEFIENIFRNTTNLTHHYIAGNGFFSSKLLLELNSWARKNGFENFPGLISVAPYEFAWYGSFVANIKKDCFIPRAPLIMAPVIDESSVRAVQNSSFEVPGHFFGILFQPTESGLIQPHSVVKSYLCMPLKN
jgi:hypothetical protein